MFHHRAFGHVTTTAEMLAKIKSRKEISRTSTSYADAHLLPAHLLPLTPAWKEESLIDGWSQYLLAHFSRLVRPTEWGFAKTFLLFATNHPCTTP